MTKILVTGAAGFIGSHVAEKFLKNGYEVVGLDNLNNYYPLRYKDRNIELLTSYDSFRFVKADLEDAASLMYLFKKESFSHIAHLAARAGVRPSIVDPKCYYKSNVMGTLNLLEAAKLSIPANIVITSSSSVYGNSKRTPFKEDDSATDYAISPYAASKKATEVLAYTYHHLYGLNINVVRPFTVYGPRGRPDMAPWIFLSSILNGKTIYQYGDGTTRRDYTYIDDFVSGFIEALLIPLGYEIFNLGNSETVSLKSALSTIAEIADKVPNIVQQPIQPGDVEITNADIGKAKEKLGYNPQTSFETGMRHFYEWFIKEEQGKTGRSPIWEIQNGSSLSNNL